VRYWTREDVQLIASIGSRLGRPGRLFIRILEWIQPAVAKTVP